MLKGKETFQHAQASRGPFPPPQKAPAIGGGLEQALPIRCREDLHSGQWGPRPDHRTHFVSKRNPRAQDHSEKERGHGPSSG